VDKAVIGALDVLDVLIKYAIMMQHAHIRQSKYKMMKDTTIVLVFVSRIDPLLIVP
jgi:hypothetical protein